MCNAAIEVGVHELVIVEQCECVAFYGLEKCPLLEVSVSGIEVSSDGIVAISLFPVLV